MSFAERRRAENGLELERPKTTILVEPVGGGWCVSSSLEETLMFLSGGLAELQARRLARCLASLGQDTVVEIHDRTDRVVGAVLYASGDPQTRSLSLRDISAIPVFENPRTSEEPSRIAWLPRPDRVAKVDEQSQTTELS
jgi:hypothetical protein